MLSGFWSATTLIKPRSPLIARRGFATGSRLKAGAFCFLNSCNRRGSPVRCYRTHGYRSNGLDSHRKTRESRQCGCPRRASRSGRWGNAHIWRPWRVGGYIRVRVAPYAMLKQCRALPRPCPRKSRGSAVGSPRLNTRRVRGDCNNRSRGLGR